MMIKKAPNFLTIIRIAMIPMVVSGIYIDTNLSRWIAFAFYATAGVTDFLDGYIARSTGNVTPFGKLLDPIADKLLVATVIVSLIELGSGSGGLSNLNALAGLIIILREIAVSGLREYLAEIKIGVPVSKLAKVKTLIQMLSLGFLIVGDEAAPTWIPSFSIGITLLWTAVVLTLVTAMDYINYSTRHWKSPK